MFNKTSFPFVGSHGLLRRYSIFVQGSTAFERGKRQVMGNESWWNTQKSIFCGRLPTTFILQSEAVLAIPSDAVALLRK